MNFLPIALGVAAIAIVLLLPHLRRLTGFYPPSIPIGDLHERITCDALAGSALGSVLSTLQSYSILSQLRGLSMPSPQFSGLVVAFLLGWLIAGPAGGVINTASTNARRKPPDPCTSRRQGQSARILSPRCTPVL